MLKIKQTAQVVLGQGADNTAANAAVTLGTAQTLRANTRWKTQLIEGNLSPNGGAETCLLRVINSVTGDIFAQMFCQAPGPFQKESQSKRGLGLIIEVGADPITVILQATKASTTGALPVNAFATLEAVLPNAASQQTSLALGASA